MIYILVFLLWVNVVWAYRRYKALVAPPVLLGGGMLMASIIASTYYDEWGLSEMYPSTVLILGGGPLFFTYVCQRLYPDNHACSIRNVENVSLDGLCVGKFKVILILSILLGLFTDYMIVHLMISSSGAAKMLSELILETRLNQNEEFSLPIHIKLFVLYNSLLSYFVTWILALSLLPNRRKDWMFVFLLICQIIVVVIGGFLNGSKGNILDPILRFLMTYLIVLYIDRKRIHLSNSFILKLGVMFLVFVYLFKAINAGIGRNVDVYDSNFDYIAEYCGAQIKNFDIYMHKPYDYVDSGIWGEQTFHDLYADIGIDVVSIGDFEDYNNYSLGNVRTMYFSLYKDFGLIGVTLFTVFMSTVCMHFYNKMMKSLIENPKLNLYMLIYLQMAFSVFMSFFSNTFTLRVVRLSFIRNYFIFMFCLWAFNRFLYKRQNSL